MSGVLARKIGIFVLSLVILFFISGCETVVAMKKRDVTMNDLVQIVQLRNKPRLLAFSAAKKNDSQWRNPIDLQKMDNWFQNKFW